MNTVEQSLDLLGRKVVDKITLVEGIVTSICFDLYGCIQAIVTPSSIDDKKSDIYWSDIKRLTVVSEYKVMEVSFNSKYGNEPGPAEKPLPDHS
jgi:hypothetical protein